MDLYHEFKVDDIIRVTGREGTNGTLEYGELYEVIALTKENERKFRDMYFYACKPIVVLDSMRNEVRPFLGKIGVE